MENCPYCQTTNPEGSLYCGGCGIKNPCPQNFGGNHQLMVFISALTVILFISGVWLIQNFGINDEFSEARSAYLDGYGPRIFSQILEDHLTEVQWSSLEEQGLIPVFHVRGHFDATDQQVEFFLLFDGRRKVLEIGQVKINGNPAPTWETHSILSFMYGRIPGL